MQIMNLYILYFFFLSFYFINYVNGFKMSSDVSCALINSRDNYTYTWVFKEFQDLCNRNYFSDMHTLSEKFYSPITNSQGEYYSYRFSLQPHLNNGGYLKIYLI